MRIRAVFLFHRHGRITLTFGKGPLQNVFANGFADVTVDNGLTLKGYTITSNLTFLLVLLLA